MAAEQDMGSQRLVGTLWCSEVLDALPDLLEGELSQERAAAVQDHLAGCDWCERFGGAYGRVVGALRGVPEPMPASTRARLSDLLEDLEE